MFHFTVGRTENSGDLLEADDEGCDGLPAAEPLDDWADVRHGVDERALQELHDRRHRRKVGASVYQFLVNFSKRCMKSKDFP